MVVNISQVLSGEWDYVRHDIAGGRSTSLTLPARR